MFDLFARLLGCVVLRARCLRRNTSADPSVRAPIPRGVFRRRGSKALEAMSPLQREVFLRLRRDEVSYGALASDLEVSVPEVEEAFHQALVIFCDAFEGLDFGI
ncbi:sigma factor-like helix-turn-helix DNA-binding protein [Novosphingobium sp. BL-52-GroH]|uniref:sigma factor-like helix-turn-helix DNA-binding protein n=1 Tax=Novosphingobium sp. BL-52-GroH TaxID=3349877 RepID=UPI00384BEB0A